MPVIELEIKTFNVSIPDALTVLTLDITPSLFFISPPIVHTNSENDCLTSFIISL